MLSHIEDNGSFDEALLLAQRAGYAELDPVADLSGADAAAKLAILSTIAWRVPVCASEIATEGIDSSVVAEAQRARRQGRRLRFVAQAHRNGALRASVRPALLPEGDLLARAQGVENVIQIEAALAGTLSWRGPGAGGLATASSLLGDVVCGAAHLIQHTRRSFYGGC
jgi:homoserine dehydrogenase